MVHLLRRILGDLTVAEGWDEYARRNQHRPRLGDEWNRPEVVGIDAAPDDLVAALDRRIFAPFLGECDTLLEIGSGGGRFTEILLPKCRRLLAVDTSPYMLKALRRRFDDQPKLEARLGNGSSLQPVADQSVDAVFSYGVFVHLQHWDIFNYLTEIQRVLKPRGKAVLQHANTFSEKGWQRFLQDMPSLVNRHKSAESHSVMTPELMGEFARRAGLSVIESVTQVVQRDCVSLLEKDCGEAKRPEASPEAQRTNSLVPVAASTRVR